jgi:hypothetical protein
MTRHRTTFRVAFGLLCGLVWSAPARAYEDQASLDLSAGPAILAHSRTLNPVGPELAAGGALGISDLFVARAQLAYAALFDHGSVQSVGKFRAEAAYLLDVLKFVPFFGGGGSLWLYSDAGSVKVRPALHLLVGVDYLWSRQWTVGLDFRTGILFEPGNVASATDVQLRVSRMFDLF